MITVENILLADGQRKDLFIESSTHKVIDGSSLLALPGLIDTHVHFRTPGHEYKENWITGAQAAIAGGYTTVFDMPNTTPSTISKQTLSEKKALIEKQLEEAGIPLNYGLYLGVDKNHFDEISKCLLDIVALKIFMSSSTGSLLVSDDSSLHAAFALAKAFDLLICTHAEDETTILKNTDLYQEKTFSTHSLVRDEVAAAKGVEKAISLAKLYNIRLHILHVSTQDEIALIRQAKDEGVLVTAEATPQHLFLDDVAYNTLGSKAQINPALRDKKHRIALLKAVQDGIIDTIGSDHAPHTLEEKALPYGKAPSGMPGIETTLPLLLTAYHNKLLTLEQIQKLTHDNPKNIYRLESQNDWTLVDLAMEKTISKKDLKTKCGWSAFEGMTMKGFPVYTILKGHIFTAQTLGALTC